MDPTTPVAPALQMPPDLAQTPHDLSAIALFLQADPVVKGVMLILILASVACWAVIFEKAWILTRLRREARALRALGGADSLPVAPPEGEDLCATTLRAGIREWREGRDEAETLGEYRDRLERAMRAAVAAGTRRAEAGLPLLATVGSVAPFIGLFGTVWGIMNSFSSIAASNDTSLAVVAPGIAEALFATAIGLVAAIPAVIAYNRLTGSLARTRRDALSIAAELAGRLSRRAAGPRPAAAMHRLQPAE